MHMPSIYHTHILIQFVSKMDRKTNLLSNLKKQVLALKSQLQTLEKHKSRTPLKHHTPNKTQHCSQHHQSMSTSNRFDSATYDSTYLDKGKGVKKFALAEGKCKNIVQVIKEKSVVEKVPAISRFRQAQYNKTKENFSTERLPTPQPRCSSPNPLTGQGYYEKRNGIKTVFPPRKIQPERSSNKKHFHIF